MADTIQFRRGNTAANAGYAGLAGEITVDTTKQSAAVHSGAGAGTEVTLATEDQVNTVTLLAKALDKSQWPTLTWVNTEDITFNAGTVLDSTGAVAITLTTNETRESDTTWDGASNKGLFSGATLASGGTVHCFVIMDTSGNVECGFDDNLACTNIPGAYTYFRRIGSVRFDDAAVTIPSFFQNGDRFIPSVSTVLESGSSLGVTAVLEDTLIPEDIALTWIGAVSILDTTAGSGSTYMLVTSPTATATAPSSTFFTVAVAIQTDSGDDGRDSAEVQVITNTSAEVRYELSTDSTSIFGLLRTIGWIDERLV